VTGASFVIRSLRLWPLSSPVLRSNVPLSTLRSQLLQSRSSGVIGMPGSLFESSTIALILSLDSERIAHLTAALRASSSGIAEASSYMALIVSLANLSTAPERSFTQRLPCHTRKQFQSRSEEHPSPKRATSL